MARTYRQEPYHRSYRNAGMKHPTCLGKKRSRELFYELEEESEVFFSKRNRRPHIVQPHDDIKVSSRREIKHS